MPGSPQASLIGICVMNIDNLHTAMSSLLRTKRFDLYRDGATRRGITLNQSRARARKAGYKTAAWNTAVNLAQSYRCAYVVSTLTTGIVRGIRVEHYTVDDKPMIDIVVYQNGYKRITVANLMKISSEFHKAVVDAVYNNTDVSYKYITID